MENKINILERESTMLLELFIIIELFITIMWFIGGFIEGFSIYYLILDLSVVPIVIVVFILFLFGWAKFSDWLDERGIQWRNIF